MLFLQNDIQVQKILKENVKGRKKMRPFEYSLVRDEDTDLELEEGGTTTILEFPVKNHHVKQGSVKVTCKASASNGLYESETDVKVPVVRSFSFFERSSARVAWGGYGVSIKIILLIFFFL